MELKNPNFSNVITSERSKQSFYQRLYLGGHDDNKTALK